MTFYDMFELVNEEIPDPRATPVINPAERKELAKEAVESGNHLTCYCCETALETAYGRGMSRAIQRTYRGHKGLFVLSLCVNCARYTFTRDQ